MKKNALEDKNILQDFASLKLLWPYLRPYKRLIVYSVLLIPAISAFQALVPLVIKTAIDRGILKNDYQQLSYAALNYCALVFALYVTRTLQAYITSLAVYRMIKDLRNSLISHILHLNSHFHDKTLSGALATRATSDFDNLSESLNQGVLSSIVDFAVLAGCVIGMYLLDPILATAALLLFPAVTYIVTTISKQIKDAMLSARKIIASLNAFAQECLYGSSTIKLLDARKDANEHYAKLNIEYRDAQMKSVVYDSLMFSIIDGISSIAIGITLWLAISNIFAVEGITAGVIVAFVQYLNSFFEPIKQLGNKIAMLQGAFTAIDRIFGLFDTKDFISGTSSLKKINGDIKFENVNFSYAAAAGAPLRPILKNINFTLQAGQSLALVGTTGSGKSTLVKLLCKLYDGYTGKIILDGADLSELSGEELRSSISFVPQDLVIFEGSIAFNIGLGDPRATEEKIIAAAKLVGADRFIEKMPGKYDELLREQGSNLSQGQRQLLAFARAIVKDPQILILDEATSSIDPESENIIQHTIAKIIKGRTVIVIAHRLSTIKNCDKILVVENGEIREQGTHKELLSNTLGKYFSLHHVGDTQTNQTTILP